MGDRDVTGMLIVHTPQDAAAAIGVCAILSGAVATPLDAVVRGPQRAPLMLLWSAASAKEGAGPRLAELAMGRLSPVILCLLDDAPLGPDLETIDVAQFDGALSGRDFTRAAHDALIVARRRGIVRRKSAHVAKQDEHGFAGGLARGFMSSAAVFGLGSVVAVGATSGLDALANGEDFSLFGTPAAEASEHHEIVEAAPLSDAALRRAVEDLQQTEFAEREEIEQRLATAEMMLKSDPLAESAIQSLKAMEQQVSAAPVRARPLVTQADMVDVPLGILASRKDDPMGGAG